MVKNVTVQVGDELAAKMEKLVDVNWSQVVRGCLERYCDVRLNPDIEALIRKMKDQKEEAYAEGYKAALDWFKQEGVRYEDVNTILRQFGEFNSSFRDKVLEDYGSWEDAIGEGAMPDEDWESKKHRFWKGVIGGCISELPGTYEVSDAFIMGFESALKKLEKTS